MNPEEKEKAMNASVKSLMKAIVDGTADGQQYESVPEMMVAEMADWVRELREDVERLENLDLSADETIEGLRIDLKEANEKNKTLEADLNTCRETIHLDRERMKEANEKNEKLQRELSMERHRLMEMALELAHAREELKRL
jgi:chromosome segregation ATPase